MFIPKLIAMITDLLIVLQISGIIAKVTVLSNWSWWIVFSPALFLITSLITTVIFCFISNIIRVYIEDNIYFWRRSKKFYLTRRRKVKQ